MTTIQSRQTHRARAGHATLIRHLTVLLVLAAMLTGSEPAGAQSLCDPDGDGHITDTDAVRILSAAALLPGVCPLAACDTDGDGRITDVDGMNALRAAAALPSPCDAGSGPVCGDGIVDAPEQCEPPGTPICTATCTTVAPSITEIIDATGDGDPGDELFGPNEIAADVDGTVYLSGVLSGNTFRIERDGTIDEILGAGGDGLAVDQATGDVYASGEGLVFKVTSIGVIIPIFDEAIGDGVNGLDDIDALAVDQNDGSVYVTGSSGPASPANAFRITLGGIVTRIIDSAGAGIGAELAGPNGIAVDGDGNVYVSGGASNNAFRIAPNGSITEIIDETGAGMGNGLVGPSEIIVDAAGNAYVEGPRSPGAPPDEDNVYRISPNGTIAIVVDGARDDIDTGDMAIDNSGNLYVTDSDANSVFQISAGGIVTRIIDGTGAGPGSPLQHPSSIAVDGNGKVFVAAEVSNNAFKIVVP